MANTQFSHLKRRVEQGVLVLTLTATHIQTDTVADAVGQQLMAAVANTGAQKVVLDLQHVKSLSSTGIRALLGLNRYLKERGGKLDLCGLSPTVEKVLNTTVLISSTHSSAAIFQTFPNVEAALASLKSTAPDA